jgi:hypothetical protein
METLQRLTLPTIKMKSEVREVMPFPCFKIFHWIKRRYREKQPTTNYEKFCVLIYKELT